MGDARTTQVMTAQPVRNPTYASLSLVFTKNRPSRNVPNMPPYVNEAIVRPSSTTGFLVSVNNIAPPIRAAPQKTVITRDVRMDRRSLPSAGTAGMRKISRYVEDARELIDEESVPMADASTAAIRRPSRP
jgi:hypothetical protein